MWGYMLAMGENANQIRDCYKVAGGSEGIKVHYRDSVKVTEDSSSEVSGKSPASKGTNLCSKEDEEVEE
ncbi:hypothetical protein V6N13_088701 [Hibiscus sabdariffa]